MYGLRIVAYEERPAYTYALGDATGAYDGRAERVTRELVYLKPRADSRIPVRRTSGPSRDGPEVYPTYLVIFDRVVGLTPETAATWVAEFAAPPERHGEIVSVEKGAAKVLCETLLPKAVSLTQDENTVTAAPTETRNGMRFLTLIQIGDTGQAFAPHRLLETDNAVGVEVSDNDGKYRVMFEGTGGGHIEIRNASGAVLVSGRLTEEVEDVRARLKVGKP
jgi:hypothetical protein